MEKWANLLFEKLQQDPPRGYRYVAHDELLRADKALRLHVAEETRAQVQGNGLKKPVDEGIEKWSLHAEIQYHIMPLPAAPHGASVTKPAASSATATAKPVVKDNDCEIKFGHQRPIRMKHNIGDLQRQCQARQEVSIWFPCVLEKAVPQTALRCGVYHPLKPAHGDPVSPCSHNSFHFVELFSGSGQLSAAMKKRGFPIFPVDHEFNSHKTAVPTISLNLQDTKNQKLVEDMLLQVRPAAIHLALPCGTCSRARRKALTTTPQRPVLWPSSFEGSATLAGVPALDRYSGHQGADSQWPV